MNMSVVAKLKSMAEMAKEEKSEGMSTSSAELGKFCSELFACADIIKIAHLKVSGPGAFAAHVALGELYDSLTDMADEITELIQGYKGILPISIPATSYMEPVAYLKSKRMSLMEMKEKVCEEMPDVENKIQDMIGVVSRTIYKLENLK